MVAKGTSEAQVRVNLARKEHFNGELAEMSTATWERLCAGLSEMPDKEPWSEPGPSVVTDANGEIVEGEVVEETVEPPKTELPGTTRASERQLKKIAELIEQRGAATADVRRWMHGQWGITSRSQLDHEQAGLLIGHLDSLPGQTALGEDRT
jgi:hypothetical protein